MVRTIIVKNNVDDIPLNILSTSTQALNNNERQEHAQSIKLNVNL